MTVKKPNRRQRAHLAMAAIRQKKMAMRRKPPSDEIRETYECYTEGYQAGCDDNGFGLLMAMLIPTDLEDARERADFSMCMTMPREFAEMAEHLGMTVAEFRRERDRALER